MHKYVLLIFVLLCIVPIGFAQEYYSGETYEIYSIERCEGPLQIKATSEEGINANELNIVGCSKKTNGTWTCECKNNFSIQMSTLNDTFNIYDFTFQYYVEYVNYNTGGGREPSMSQIEYENNIRTHRLIDVFVQPEDKPFRFDVDVEISNVILVTVIIVLGVIGLLIFGGGRYISQKKEENQDMFSYRVKNDEDLNEDILNNIK